MTRTTIGLSMAGVLLAGGMAGCEAARLYREKADAAAYANVKAARTEALGRTAPFTIERPAGTLRRRLMLEQSLPHVSPASLSAHDIEPIPQWPDEGYLQPPGGDAATQPAGALTYAQGALHLSLPEALQVAAASSREYQAQKEQVYLAALDLDLERDLFRYTWAGGAESLFSSELDRVVIIDAEEGETDRQTVRGKQHSGSLEARKLFEQGVTLTGLIGLDLVKMLTQDRASARGIYFDGTISIPLLRGSSRFVVTEPLTQAQRDAVYAIWTFERFKRVFAVEVASEYLGVLQQLDQLTNAEANYRRLIASTRRVRRLAEAGWIPEIQVDQARQDELRASNRWIAAQQAYNRRLDAFKVTLGLPPDARVELEPETLAQVNARASELIEATLPPTTAPAPADADAPIELVPPGSQAGGPLEMDEHEAVALAFDHRLDIRVAVGRIDDAQRAVAVAADALRADLTLLGSASIGERRTLASADALDSRLRLSQGRYSALLGIDLPLERTAERNLYRISLIRFEQAVRDLQALEDEVKLQIRNHLRNLLEASESVRIQAQAVRVAERRVISTDLFLQAERAQVRDVLEAQEALISAQNALTSALVQYRVAELEMQRDLGVLEVDERGVWTEFVPVEAPDDDS